MKKEQTYNKIKNLMFSAIELTNEAQDDAIKLNKDINEIIKGDDSKLDSFALVNFLLNAEEILTRDSFKCPNLFEFIEKSSKDIFLNDIINKLIDENTS